MASKGHSESQGRARSGRRHEILGIFLLAFGLFSGLSMLAMHAGRTGMMGPGGAATASGLYGLFGMGAYLLIVAVLAVALRSFRGRSLVSGVTEGIGCLFLMSAVTVLLHLPFAGRSHTLRGPGGLMGEWLGELTAGFIGPIGAALAATAMLFVTLLLVTDIRMSEVVVVLSWATRTARRGTWMGLRALGRLVIAMFPERHASETLEADEDDDALESDRGARALLASAPESLDEMRGARLARESGVPVAMTGEETDGVRVGDARGYSSEIEDPRAAMAAIVAEVAAVEEVPAAEPESFEADDVAAGVAFDGAPAADEEAEPYVIEESALPATTALATTAAAGPIIVEPAWRTRLREREQAREDAGKDAAARKADSAGAGPSFIKLKAGAYQLPATELLEYLPPQGNDTDKQGLYEMAERLEQAMANYGVRGKVKEIHMGPVVTMFEFAPAPGTRTGKIANLEKDLAMALEAQAVRIVAPIPGKAVVGVEVPNKTREMVYLREILEDDAFTKANSKLQVALGKDIKGAPVTVNLAKMPHLLVAGTTGSGKSVAVNGMIASLLYNASPEEVRFIMVDPKMLELSIYEGIPHLLLPVVTDPKKANLALRWAVDEMERRYELLAKAGVRDITSYNTRIETDAAKVVASAESELKSVASSAPSASGKKKLKVMIAGPDGTDREIELSPDDETTTVNESMRGLSAADGVVEEPMDPDEVSAQAAAVQASGEAVAPAKKLPYIVIVIDEFADLMMVAPKDVETSVARIAQKARAAGLHLILATQRPSVDVITGLIKANFPSRIALQVASRIDSRTILDQPGADTLLGNGDMLFSDRGLKLRRVHGAFLSDDEVHRVVDHLKTQAKPVYDMDILKPREEDAEEGGAPADDFHDDLYDQAVAIVCETRQASVSYIQRRLQIGYNRSARLVEQMERDGIVGPGNGAKPREVLAPPGEYLQQAG
ncbi:MAG TPA: DNA translocase FtsK 4TM domain-containing protein [Polyangia bacterium]|jgi:S-DNA-T family DNA segregation ATPase FtsK/SpoIIIE